MTSSNGHSRSDIPDFRSVVLTFPQESVITRPFFAIAAIAAVIMVAEVTMQNEAIQTDLELRTTGELISDQRALARYRRSRTLTERVLDYVMYVLWAAAFIVAIVALFIRR
jgi:hypothetical protein